MDKHIPMFGYTAEHLEQIRNSVDNLSKRELFAAMAMQGILAGDTTHFVNEDEMDSLAEETADHAVRCADKLIYALSTNFLDEQEKRING